MKQKRLRANTYVKSGVTSDGLYQCEIADTIKTYQSHSLQRFKEHQPAYICIQRTKQPRYPRTRGIL
jgi:hypothetical protein